MRSAGPIPGNPWPHDMVITVDDDPQQLLELLWLRDRWLLASDHPDPPPSLVLVAPAAAIRDRRLDILGCRVVGTVGGRPGARRPRYRSGRARDADAAPHGFPRAARAARRDRRPQLARP